MSRRNPFRWTRTFFQFCGCSLITLLLLPTLFNLQIISSANSIKSRDVNTHQEELSTTSQSKSSEYLRSHGLIRIVKRWTTNEEVANLSPRQPSSEQPPGELEEVNYESGNVGEGEQGNLGEDEEDSVDVAPTVAPSRAINVRPSRQSVDVSTNVANEHPTVRPITNARRPLNAEQATSNHQLEASSTTTTTARNPAAASSRAASRHQAEATSFSPPTTFNLDMGADQLLLKNHNRRAEEQPMSTTVRSFIGERELATESVNHVLLANQNSIINERRQDLLYPSTSFNGVEPTSTGHPNQWNSGRVEAQQELSVQSICYTPLALFLVILATMLVTIAVCFCTHLLVKQLGRRQFDLIENSKHYGISGFAQGAANTERRPLGSSALSKADESPFYALNKRSALSSAPMMSPHKPVAMSRLRDDCAFDNPYFKATESCASDQNDHFRHHQQQQQVRVHESGNSLLRRRSADLPVANQQGGDQLYFIQDHISNLHNRQVTSSVKELSILGRHDDGEDETTTIPQVVDLTSDEQRARVITDPKEGDLLAVDITGHDFIGLGFDVCGNQQDGIYIKSVLNSGPARESGCIHPGDRVKCLNVSFEGMTLQDASDMLNCASPYKMRLLLEKQVAQAGRLLDASVDKRHRFPDSFVQANYYSNATARQQQQSSVGPLEVTRNYVKRLVNFVSAPNNAAQDKRKGSQMFEQQPPVYLGSLAARHQFSTRSNLLNGSHVNAAYGSDDELAHHVTSLAGAHRMSVKGSETFGSMGEETPDTSLDYQSKNAHHKLHGPVMYGADRREEYRELDLRLTGAQHTDAAGGRRPISVATGKSEINLNSKVDFESEQTRSQPEIAETNQSTGQGNNDRNFSGSSMVNSVSTPTINLLANQPVNWRISSRRRRGETRDDIREEYLDEDRCDSGSEMRTARGSLSEMSIGVDSPDARQSRQRISSAQLSEQNQTRGFSNHNLVQKSRNPSKENDDEAKM